MHGHEVSDRFLRELWAQVTCLREHRIAHRDLRRANVLVDADGEPWLTGFAFSEVAASDEQLDGDVAQLLAALSLTVGAERSVTQRGRDARSADGRGRAPAAAAQRAQRLDPRRARASARASSRSCRTPSREQCDVARADLRPARTHQQATRSSPRRCSWRSPTSSCRSWPTCRASFREIGAADWGWVPLVVLFSALTYVGAALGMGGAVPARLRAVPTLLAQVAASFASNLAPAGVGGMALNVRYLQKSGVDAPVAASSVGLNSVAGFAVHLVLMFVFFVWAGQSGARLDLAAELVGRRHRRRRGRGVRRGGVRDPGHPQAARHEARTRARAAR